MNSRSLRSGRSKVRLIALLLLGQYVFVYLALVLIDWGLSPVGILWIRNLGSAGVSLLFPASVVGYLLWREWRRS